MVEGGSRKRLKKKTPQLLIGGFFICGVGIAMYFVTRDEVKPPIGQDQSLAF